MVDDAEKEDWTLVYRIYHLLNTMIVFQK